MNRCVIFLLHRKVRIAGKRDRNRSGFDMGMASGCQGLVLWRSGTHSAHQVCKHVLRHPSVGVQPHWGVGGQGTCVHAHGGIGEI